MHVELNNAIRLMALEAAILALLNHTDADALTVDTEVDSHGHVTIDLTYTRGGVAIRGESV